MDQIPGESQEFWTATAEALRTAGASSVDVEREEWDVVDRDGLLAD